MSQETVLITGITGFVGRYLSKLLNDKLDCRIYGTAFIDFSEVPEALNVFGCDLRDASSLTAIIRWIKPTLVYHLAAQSAVQRSIENPAETFESNIMGTVNLYDSLRNNCDTRVITAGSVEVYGIVPPEKMPITEDCPINPVNPYAVSKAAQDLISYQYYKTYGLKTIRIRPFNHIGPGQSTQFVTSSFAKQIAEIETGKISPEILVGNLEAYRDFTDVRDMVKAYLYAAKLDSFGEAFNICSGRAVSIKWILDYLLSMSKVKIEIKQDPSRLRPSDNPYLSGDCSKFKNLTGWSPETPLETSLKDILDYWRKADNY